MQAENKKNNILSLSMGCRLNALEAEKIKKMLSSIVNSAILVNSCAVTAEAERQSGQTVRKIARKNPSAPIFVTGCAATRNPDLFFTGRVAGVSGNAQYGIIRITAIVQCHDNRLCERTSLAALLVPLTFPRS